MDYDDLPFQKWWYSIAMLNNQKVHHTYIGIPMIFSKQIQPHIRNPHDISILFFRNWVTGSSHLESAA